MNGIRIRKTGAPDVVVASDGRLTLSVPIQIKRRSGRKLVTLPNGEAAQPRPWDGAPEFDSKTRKPLNMRNSRK
jgi:hypothetical protein